MSSMVRLGSVADVFNGKTPSKAEQRDAGHPVLKIRDVDEFGKFRGAFESFVEPRLAAKHSARHVKEGDTLILNAAHNANYVGSKTCLADLAIAGALATGEWLIVRPNSELIDPAYVNFWVRSQSARDAIRFIVKGIHLYPKDVAELPIFLPSLDEQRHVVDLLSSAESIVRLRREAQQKAAELVPAIFLELFGDPIANPKKWPTTNFASFGELRLGKMLDKKRQTSGIQLPYLRNINVQWDHIDVTDVLEMGFKQEELEKFLLRDGDVLICEGGEVGRAAIWRGQLPECYYQKALHRLTPNLETVRADFVVWLLWHLAKAGALVGGGSHATIPHLTASQLRELRVIAPEIAVQIKFEALVQAAHSIGMQQDIALQRASATFESLLNRFFGR